MVIKKKHLELHTVTKRGSTSMIWRFHSLARKSCALVMCAPHHLTPPPKHHSSLTRVSSPTHASSHTPYSQLHPYPHSHHHPHPLMNDANFSRTSPTLRTTSLADLVHKTETTPPLQLIHRPRTPNSDDGSQQERNHQRPPISNLPRLPPPGDGSRTARNSQNIETSPKHNYRKRNLANPAPTPPDFSSLTQKPDDHASSVIHHPPRVRVSPQRPDQSHPEKRLRPEGIEGSTEVLPSINPEQQSPSSKLRRRSLGKDSRFDLLEENRALRIDLENAKYRIRKLESIRRRQKKDVEKRDLLLNRYRSQLVGLFETGDDDMFRITKPRAIRASSRSPENHDDKDPSRMDGESISNSQHEEEDWSAYSAPSESYDPDRSDELKRNQDRTLYARTEDGIRKHRRTRAPAWTPQEEERFLEAYAKHGCRWKMFQEALPGRSRRQIQSHGSYLIRQGKLPKKNSRPWQRRKPVSGVPSSSVKEAEIDLDDAERSDGERV